MKEHIPTSFDKAFNVGDLIRIDKFYTSKNYVVLTEIEYILITSYEDLGHSRLYRGFDIETNRNRNIGDIEYPTLLMMCIEGKMRIYVIGV